MQIAVIGFRKMHDFKYWCNKENLRRLSDKIYIDDKYNEYYGIFDQIDLVGRMFDGFIEYDELKEDLMKRIRRKEH